jgi:phenylacetate-CoA ligase
MLVIRGENVFPSAVDEVLNRLPHYGGEHRIIATREHAMDELTVRMEYDAELAGLGEGSIDGVRERAEVELRVRLGVRARVEMLSPGSLERTEFKARRVIDSRDLLRGVTT